MVIITLTLRGSHKVLLMKGRGTSLVRPKRETRSGTLRPSENLNVE